MSGPASFIREALAPLRRYADFRGRSTCSELIAFAIFCMFAALLFELVLAWPLSAAGAPPWLEPRDLFMLATLWPWTALAVRRFHDQGKSGWWLLLALPPAAVNALKYYEGMQPPFYVRVTDQHMLELAALPFAFVLLVLLLWNTQEGANAYGPDPRDDEPARTGDRAEGAASRR